LARVRVHGKFFWSGTEKVFVRGVTYGPFRPDAAGDPLPPLAVVRHDFRRIVDLGANTVRTFTPPPAWLLDEAEEAGLRLIVGIPWAQHVAFLGRPAERDARARIERTARDVGGHSAVLALLLGNETPPDVVRWERAARVERFLTEMADVARQSAPEALVSYASFPPTEYLDLDFCDFLSFNVYLHREHDLRRYLARLQNLAGERPLVLTEIGIDSRRHGAEAQAETLRGQVRAVFESGAAGVVVFAYTDEWFALEPDRPEGGFAVEDWSFGLVDAHRAPKPAWTAVRDCFRGGIPEVPAEAPLVSVVVCAFNAERTLRACLASLERLRYPRFEVLVVDDGSTDGTGAIAASLASERIRVLSQENRGLSAARNRGVAEALGSVVAFTDSDCVVDPDWLTYLAYAIRDGAVAVGGPNLAPTDAALVPAVVALAPGGPTHVLLDDDVAEHIPGCNMAFDRATLLATGGFDERYTTAGDDVDVCWRLQDAGHPIAFSPAAVVWHFRRDTVRAYLRQQGGYGRAEAQLYFDHPRRFNALGQSTWAGRIYGGLVGGLAAERTRIYRGPLGQGLFQAVYARPASIWWHLPATFEWNLFAAALLFAALLGRGGVLVAAVPLLVSLAAATVTALRAPLDARLGAQGRVLLAVLSYLGPLTRSLARTNARVTGAGRSEPKPASLSGVVPEVSLARAELLSAYWSEEGVSKEVLLGEVERVLAGAPYRLAYDAGWNAWDVELARGPWTTARIEVAVENHGGSRRLLRVRAALPAARIATLVGVLCAAVALVASASFGSSGAMRLVRASAWIGAAGAATIALWNMRLAARWTRFLDAAAFALRLVPVQRGPGR